jgi:hypothetical protein
VPMETLNEVLTSTKDELEWSYLLTVIWAEFTKFQKSPVIEQKEKKLEFENLLLRMAKYDPPKCVAF